MQMNELTPGTLAAAEREIGQGPVVMVNLLWFRTAAEYPANFEGAKPDARSAYYEAYAGAFRAIAQEMGVATELVYAGSRLAGFIAGSDDDWDDMVLVRYNSLADLRKVVESETYAVRANPHRMASIRNWRFIATRSL